MRLVHVGTDIPRSTHGQGPSTGQARFRQRMEEQIRDIEARGGVVEDSFGVPGELPGHEVVELSRDEDVGLVIVGDARLGRFRYALRERAPAQVVRDADCPVMVVRGAILERYHDVSEAAMSPRTVLVATDGSRQSAYAIHRSAEIARASSPLHVVHVYQDVNGEQRAREILEQA